jgi:hypothetical protein
MRTHDVLPAADDHAPEAKAALVEVADGFCSEANLLMQDLIAARERLDQMSDAVEVIASAATVLTTNLQRAAMSCKLSN